MQRKTKLRAGLRPSHPQETPELVLVARSEDQVEHTREFAYFH